MNRKLSKYNQVLEDVRHSYKQKYGVVLDDELLYLLVRMNELQQEVKKEMSQVQKVTFRKGTDYFWYGVGKTLSFLMFGVGLMVLSAFLYESNRNQRTYELAETKWGTVLKLEGYGTSGDTVIHISSKK